jgi:hypothetical protein
MDFYCGIEEVLVLLEKTKKRKNTNGELMSNILYNVKEKHKWLFEEKQNYIISNDVDGLLSGLLLQHCVNGSIVGVYDCKQLYVCKDIDVNDAIFVDIEIWRSQVRSIGHHMLCYSPKNLTSKIEHNLHQCIQPNIIDKKFVNKQYGEKYPLGTIHLLWSLFEMSLNNIDYTWLLMADGMLNNYMKYSANVIRWLEKLNLIQLVDHTTNLHRDIRLKIDSEYDNFLKIGNGKRRSGDKILLTNIENNCLSKLEIDKIVSLLERMSSGLGLSFVKHSWKFLYSNKFNIFNFDKHIDKNAGTIQKYNEIQNLNPITLAYTGAKEVQYTLDPNEVFTC